jgi:hypothetical protein
LTAQTCKDSAISILGKINTLNIPIIAFVHADVHTLPNTCTNSLPSFYYSVTVRLLNTQDPGRERLSTIQPSLMGITLSTSDDVITLTGDFPASLYTAVVRTVAYEHLSFLSLGNQPSAGNPTTDAVR